MDRDEALRHLRRGRLGVSEWNRQRAHGAGTPPLDHVDLSGEDLGGADFHDMDMSGSSLVRANLRRVNLRGADLRGAKLAGADLRGATVQDARFEGSMFAFTIISDIDLSTAIGLEAARHEGPSTVGVSTLIRSRGTIPGPFLRGCGVPDALIDFLPSLIGAMQPVQFHSCFISHSTKYQEFADRLYSRMIQEGLRVWYAPDSMRGGRRMIDQIDRAIRAHDKLLLVLSRASMASGWVLQEIRRAVEREKREKRHVLFPIGLASGKEIKAWRAFDSDMGIDLANVIREYHILTFPKWRDRDSFEASFARLLEDLRASE